MGASGKKGSTGNNSQNVTYNENYKNEKGRKKENPANEARDLITIIDRFFSRHSFIVFIISLFLTIILGIFLFDLKISEGGDDSDYILSAKKFLDGRQFPFWHGSFYPIFLSIILLIFGFNVVIFKISSFIFIILHLTFFYYALRKRISATFLCLATLFTAVNANILYYASQTYSEAIYMFLQAVILYVFLAINDNLDKKPYKLAEHWKSWLLFGFLALLISTTRTVGYSMLMAVILYLLISREYRAALYAFISYLLFLIPYSIYKWIVWDLIPGKSGGGRFEVIFYKNPYSKAAGTEDLAGMITRFIENSKIYLSKHFFIITGLKNPALTETSVILTVLMYALFLIALIYAFKKSRTLFFVALYLAFSVGITFITLQQSWGQQRLILVYVPLILILFPWGICQFFNSRILLTLFFIVIGILQFFIKDPLSVRILVFISLVSVSIVLLAEKKALSVVKIFLHVLLIILFIVILFQTIGYTAEKIKDNKKTLAKNLKGNLYYGFTPDWVNFLKMSEWVGRNIPDSIVVASRKPSMSFIYSKGKEFYPIYSLPMENGDTIIQNLREKYSDLCFIENSEFGKKKVPGNVHMNFRRINLAFVGKENVTYGIYKVRDNYKESLNRALDTYNIENIQEADTFLAKIRNEGYYGIYPDTLLNMLRKNKVDYVIMASLRVNPNMKTNRTINTVRRFLYYIELKYPGTFMLVYQIGNQDQEPAYLYKVNYDKYSTGN